MEYRVVDNIYIEMLLNKALKEKTLVLNDEISTESCYKIAYYMDRIKKLDDAQNIPDSEKIINIEVSSPGGSCMSGFFLISKIIEFKEKYNYKIIITVNEDACSMAFLLLTVCSLRRMRKYSECMLHQPLSASWGYEKLGDIEERCEILKRMWEKSKEIVLEYTNLPEEFIDDVKKSKEDRYFTAEEALKYGIIDEIL